MTYKTHLRYRLYLLAGLVMAALLVWNLVHTVEPGTILFIGICLLLVVWNVSASLSWVAVEPDRVILHGPFGGARAVEFRQLLSVTEEGRFGHAILLLYHPKLEQGLLDLDEVRSLALPAVADQEQLLENLSKRVPV